MSRFLYFIAINIYRVLIWIAAPFNQKAGEWKKGRKSLFRDLEQNASNIRGAIWFHCASVGEFEQARPLIEAIKLQKPDEKILLSFFSPSGYRLRKNYAHAEYVCYLPFDSRKNARKFLKIAKPRMAIFVKYEFWFFFLNELSKQNIPVFLISAIFREKQLFFKPVGKWFLNQLRIFEKIFVQDANSKKLLNNNGISNARLAGDTRFDRVWEVVSQTRKIEIIEAFKGDSFLLVAGSTWPEDEKLLKAFYRVMPENSKIVIAPHEIHASRIQGLVKDYPGDSVLYSAWNDLYIDKRILIVDNVGLLSSIYAYADVAYVGGAFRTGLHNVLEPAAHSVPVLFGPEYSKFREAEQLILAGGAFSVHDPKEFISKMQSLLAEKELLLKFGEASGRFVVANKGATAQILKNISL